MGWKIVRTLTPAKITGEATIEQISWMLNWSTRNPECVIHIWDNKYRLASKQDMQRFVRWDRTNNTKYVEDWHDCDDFAVRLWGNCKEWTQGLAFGFLIIPGHALNFCIDDEWKMWAIDNNDDFDNWINYDYPNRALEMII